MNIQIYSTVNTVTKLKCIIINKLLGFFACSHDYVRGSVTIYIINLHRSRKKIKLAGTLRNKTVHQYLLQPFGTEGLHST